MRKKNILILIPNLRGGGSERFASNLSELLVKDFNVYFAVFDSSSIDYKVYGNFIDLNVPSKNHIIGKILNIVIRVNKLNKIIDQYNIDYLYSFTDAANKICVLTSNKCKKIISFRGFKDIKDKGRLYKKYLNKIDAIILNSQEMADYFKVKYKVNKSKIFTLYNIFNYDLITKLSTEEVEDSFVDMKSKHRLICTCSRFAYEKGHWHLIKSFDIIKQKLPDVKLLLIGERGEIENDIKNMAINLPYANDIIFLGFKENPFKYISICDCFVMSSIYEGFPNALVEALMCDVPVVSTACKTGPTEILSNHLQSVDITNVNFTDYGVLTPEFSKKICFNVDNKEKEHYLFAEAVIEILTNENINKKYSNLGKKISQKFNHQEIYNQFLNILKRI